jgi:hypothetical protein
MGVTTTNNNNVWLGCLIGFAVVTCSLVLLVQREDVAMDVAHHHTHEAVFWTHAGVKPSDKVEPEPTGSAEMDAIQVDRDKRTLARDAEELRQLGQQSATLNRSWKTEQSDDKEQMAATRKAAARIADGVGMAGGDVDPPWTHPATAAAAAAVADVAKEPTLAPPSKTQPPPVPPSAAKHSMMKPPPEELTQAHTRTPPMDSPPPEDATSPDVALLVEIKPKVPAVDSTPSDAPRGEELKAAEEISAKASAAQAKAATLSLEAQKAWAKVDGGEAQDVPSVLQQLPHRAASASVPEVREVPTIAKPSSDSPPVEAEDTELSQSDIGDELMVQESREKHDAIDFGHRSNAAFKAQEAAVARKLEQPGELERSITEERAAKAREKRSALAAKKQAQQTLKRTKEEKEDWVQHLQDAVAAGEEKGTKAAEVKEHASKKKANQENLDQLIRARRQKQKAQIQKAASQAEHKRLEHFKRKAAELLDKQVEKQS